MNKTKRYGTENFIKINGKRVDLFSAKFVYRCEECHASLNYRGAGLICSRNPTHRGFIHRNEAARIEALQATNVNQLSDFYQIVDGKVVIKNGN
jgi:hypothetical protein